MDALTKSLGVISYKVGIYQERMGQGTAGELWDGVAD